MTGELTTWIFGLLSVDGGAQADAAMTVLVLFCLGRTRTQAASPKAVLSEKQHWELTCDE